ncbi:mitotic checkpoint serine/threonine-protein kinase BUB1 [Rosa rugosa]|uniref:mitotic checkpoint serine/threonine-protein kinase BUB1 n=1 Tax=Rosa rugosa TaxID=74645 RepID=UPI002B414F03|nr:mitotic checkpoint serine/threonine-protein kinase BUB1 [Rosa rugosa]
MAAVFQHSPATAIPLHDPLLPSLRLIKQALDDFNSGNHSGSDLTKLLSDCIAAFKDNVQYRDDARFLKIWFLYMGFIEDFEGLFMEMLDRKICIGQSLLYVWYASFLESKGKLYDAHMVYQMGISRNAKPAEWVKKAHGLFLERMSELASSTHKVDDGESIQFDSHINPWSSSTIKALLKKITPQLTKYDGYHSTTKAYSGKVALSSLKNSSRNKIIEIGRTKYQITGYAGQGGFAQVYKAYVNCNPDDVVALKIQKPAFPWEFYMYRELDQRISDKERSSFGFAQRMHLYSDCSILVCNYIANGTLQDVINSFAVTGKSMEEVLCIYYTIEMLYMLETLHDVGIIHGDFKPDNLLIRYSRDFPTKNGFHDRNELTKDGFRDRSGPWLDQGLCLVDWGRGIDLRLFPDNMEFKGDCRTSGFRCVEMQENKPWTFQVDTYGLCVVVHMMLHNSYMEIDKKPSPDGGYVYLPKASFKRYWNVELWKNFFVKLLNSNPGCNDKKLLQNLRKSFQEYMCSDPHLIKKLSDLLAKQRKSMCSA